MASAYIRNTVATTSNSGVGSRPSSAARVPWGRTSACRKPNSRWFSLALISSAAGTGARTASAWAAGHPVRFAAAGLRLPEGLADPGFLGQPPQAVLASIETTAADVLHIQLGAGLDVAAVDPDGGRLSSRPSRRP